MGFFLLLRCNQCLLISNQMNGSNWVLTGPPVSTIVLLYGFIDIKTGQDFYFQVVMKDSFELKIYFFADYVKSRGKTTMPIVFFLFFKKGHNSFGHNNTFLIYNSPKNISKNYWISSINSSNKLGKIVNEQFWFLWWHHFMPPSKYSERIVSSCQVWLLGGDGKFWHVSFASDLAGGAPFFQICKHTNGNGAY